MNRQEFVSEFGRHARSLFPLLRYLVLQTETHAFCLALACAALIGFYPFCVLLLSIMRNIFDWPGGVQVVQQAIEVYYPTEQHWLIRNLNISLAQSGRNVALGSMFWVFLGAAAVFVPLEAGLNKLWKVEENRPYWHNQLLGLTLTAVCCVLAIFFVAINAVVQGIVHIPLGALAQISSIFVAIQTFSDHIVLQISGVCFFSIAIFLFYKFLPNCRVDNQQILSAAILAGLVSEIVKDIYVLTLPFLGFGTPDGSQGPFHVSVSFVILAYFETFVLLGGAFLATQKDKFPWMEFIRKRDKGTI